MQTKQICPHRPQVSPSPSAASSFLFLIRKYILILKLKWEEEKFKGKPTGHRHFSTPEELRAGTSARPRTFKKLRTVKDVWQLGN
ncbi:hypothetical protein E1A91_D05G390300v1 [Gossypium mustelinum]|uniref:Uncharacterized protein n=1 Tax=Gossypium mustelinum TaxID=34275 RepID=A0A5D2V622_GOSMU|nr:hypothetical protein E1A91_D05G390300v1 [Gossypium mustelinum]